MLFQDGVVAVAEQFLAHGDGVCPIGEGADLDVDERVAGKAVGGDGVAALLQGAYQHIGVGRVGDGGDLNHDAGRRRSSGWSGDWCS